MIKIFQILLLTVLVLICPLRAQDKAQPVQPSTSILVISCSLDPASRSAMLAKYAFDFLKSKGQAVELIDLKDYKLPQANGHGQSAYDDAQVKVLHDRILKAHGIILASPIYNASVAAVTKNLFELTSHPHKEILSGKAWRNKAIGFIGVSGGERSHLALFPFINSMIWDSKIIFVPTFVMAAGTDFDDKNKSSEATNKRIQEMAGNIINFSNAVMKGDLFSK
jgi:NAD(P)H-dependent FMN reductase